MRHRALLPAVSCLLVACVHTVVPTAPEPAARDALLVLPGFGYSRGSAKVFRSAEASLAAEGVDLYAPDYVKRGGLDDSREALRTFLSDHNLHRYRRVHVFAFIAGAWTLNPLLDSTPLPNVVTVIYDRSPMQERAPRIADDKLHFLTWLIYGRPVFDMARSAYPALASQTPRVGLLVETRPTSFIRQFRKTALSYGPLQFECTALGQRHDDCAYIGMHHDELYERFLEVLPEVVTFIRTGRFSEGASRTPPAIPPLQP